MVRVEKHLKSNKKLREMRRPKEERKQQTNPELKGTTVGCVLVEELFFLNRVCLWVFCDKNIFVNLGSLLHIALLCCSFKMNIKMEISCVEKGMFPKWCALMLIYSLHWLVFGSTVNFSIDSYF